MSRHAAPRVRRKRPWAPLAAVCAGALLVAGGLWLSFDPSAGDGPRGPLATEEVMPTGTPTPSGSPKPSVSTKPKATPRSTPSKTKPPATPTRPSASSPTPVDPPAPTTQRPTVTPSPTPTPPHTSATYHALFLINGERKEVGAAAVARYPGMDAYCQDWAEEMAEADTLVHSPHNPYSAEVIASGATSASQAVNLWMTSPPHRDIILNSAYSRIGIGYADGYWCAVFS